MSENNSTNKLTNEEALELMKQLSAEIGDYKRLEAFLSMAMKYEIAGQSVEVISKKLTEDIRKRLKDNDKQIVRDTSIVAYRIEDEHGVGFIRSERALVTDPEYWAVVNYLKTPDDDYGFRLNPLYGNPEVKFAFRSKIVMDTFITPSFMDRLTEAGFKVVAIDLRQCFWVSFDDGLQAAYTKDKVK